MALPVAAAAFLLVVAAALAVPGQLRQLSGAAGCVSQTGSGGLGQPCTKGRALHAARSVAVSADGENVYVASTNSDAVAAFDRDLVTGELAQLPGTTGCVSETGADGTCVDGKALDTPGSVAVSGDGKNVYVAAARSDAVSVFGRDADSGRLEQLAGTAGCVSRTGSGGDCADGRALDAPGSVAVSGDGENVYVASRNAVAVFARDTDTGQLTQLAGTAGCVGEFGDCREGRALGPFSVAVSADGESVYVAAEGKDSVAVLRRNTASGALTQLAGTAGCVSETGSGGTCTDGKALDGPRAVTVSVDGRNVYVASAFSDAVAVFRRNAINGGLAQLVGATGTAGCVSETGAGPCADGKALDGAISVAASADGASVYVASLLGGASAFRRSAASGALTQLANRAGCWSQTGSDGACGNGKALEGPRSVAVSANGENAYVASDFSKAVAVFAREPAP